MYSQLIKLKGLQNKALDKKIQVQFAMLYKYYFKEEFEVADA